jgi:hypothetical protein
MPNNDDSVGKVREGNQLDLGVTGEVTSRTVPPGVDPRTFFMRSAVIGAAACHSGGLSQDRCHGRAAPLRNDTFWVRSRSAAFAERMCQCRNLSGRPG